MMSPPDLNTGALAPVSDEFDGIAAAVTGEIPSDLNGTLIRNGPNPFSGRFAGHDVLSWWPEAAMLHGITFSEGNIPVYRNRWVRTKSWADYHGVESVRRPIDSNPNVNIIKHAEVVLALAEGGQPVAINCELETLGASSAHASLFRGMTAHPKIDPVTRELIMFRSAWNQPRLHYEVIDAGGTGKLEMEIPLPAPSMMHDMAVTETHSILLDLSVGYDLSLLRRGYRIPVCWQDTRQSRLGVVPRHGGKVTWYEIEPCFIQHVVNAHDAPNGIIVLDVVRYPWYFKLTPDGQGFSLNPLAVLWRYMIDPHRGGVTEQQLGDLNIELPRINESFTGRPNRYLYAVEQPTTEEMRGIIRCDLETGLTQHHRIDPSDQNSEPVFIPRAGGTSEDDGWLIVCVYRNASDTSEVRILDAKNLADSPVATIALERRIPAGFHGAWIPAESS